LLNLKTLFLKPRYVGSRFDEHTIPVEIAKDLAAYEQLIGELAKYLYKQDNPKRVRVPRGFDQKFNLHFEGMVGEGSAIPMLACVVAGTLSLSAGDQVYFEHARDLVAEVIACEAAGQPIPQAFPRPMFSYFNGFGRSLREGESMEMPRNSSTTPAVLNSTVRKALALHGTRTYTKDLELVGNVEEIDYVAKTFRYRTRMGEQLILKYLAEHEEKVREAGGKGRMWIEVKGQGVFGADDSQKEPASITHLELLPNQELVDRLTQLDALQPGWFDGEGVVPDSSLVSWLAENLSDSYPEDIAFPHVAALPEGGVYFEWITDNSRTIAEIRNGGFYADLHSTHLATGESVANRLDLNSGNGVDALFAFVREQGGTVGV
jgi:hypothetical protein